MHSELVDYAVAEFLKQYPEIDYVSNTVWAFLWVIRGSHQGINLRGYVPRCKSREAEHVTLRIRNNPQNFHIRQLPVDRIYPNISLSVDTEDDVKSLLPIFKFLSNRSKFGLSEIASLKI